MAKALKIIGLFCVICSVLILLGFVGSMRSSALCRDVIIENRTEYDARLVSEESVLAAIASVEKSVEEKPMNQIDTRSIELAVVNLPYIKSATAYKTIDKKVVVELEERKLIARLIDENGVSAFLDAEGFVLPKRRAITLRLPVISGKFKLDTDRLVKGYNSAGNPSFESIYKYAVLVVQSDFWKAQLQQTYLDSKGNFIATPQVGNHEIQFGNIEGIENKLKNLAMFYEQGMNEARWNKYKTINLKYEDQIVCTKN